MIKVKTTSFPKNHTDQLAYKHDFNKSLLNLFQQNLFETFWNSLKNIADQIDLYHEFLKIFSLIKVEIKPKIKISPWITNGITKSPNFTSKILEAKNSRE